MSNPAPEPLERFRSFVNTLDVETGRDDLATFKHAQAWLAGSGLPGSVASEEDVARLRNFRDAGRVLVSANAGNGDGSSGWAEIERQAQSVPLMIARQAGDLRLRPAVAGLEATIGTLLGILYDAAHTEMWSRLKICANDRCAVAFYDRSKNGSGTWCSMQVCGNRAKARRRRERVRRSSE